MKPIPYGRQDITEEDINAVVDTLRSDFLTQGPKIAEFEEAFADYVGAKYAVAVSNGTAALHLSTLALDVQPGDQVITTPITFAASANCVMYCGGEVIFADIDPSTYLLDINKVEEVLKSKKGKNVKGIIPVGFTGLPVDLEAFRKLADQYGLWIVEDACHAPGGYFIDSTGREQRCGNGVYADLSIFSFHPVKHIAAGEGGMITTNDQELYSKLLSLRTHGIVRSEKLMNENHGGWYYEMQSLGFNYRLTDIQSTLGLNQLKRADQGLKRRNEIAARYDEAFKDLGIIKQSRLTARPNAYHLYVIEVEQRAKMFNYLREKGIYVQVHYIPVHIQPFYQQLGWSYGDFPHAESYYERCISLPMYPSLTDDQHDYVVDAVISFIDEAE